ncbi:retrovirus-related pol polyprotein from transposon TNT 1-94 [Tanacetum coccineum]|uniref:Retrovirus-related pol polyprotein from transposon TNT 1-94 n=1 Tax=Tanacetum coccineum TaxID=301880 RepID=A0ABQ4YZZ7_9ASTR
MPTFDHEDQDTPDYDTEIDEDNNRDNTPSSSVLQETNDTSQARYPTRSNRGGFKRETSTTRLKWKKAMNEEMEALQKNQTWELVKLPPKKTVRCRWIYTVKLDSKGNIDRYKARLVAKGYTQKYRIDYGDMFAPVAKMNTIRILISIAANQDWPLKQFDVKNAFLNGYLKEEVYMDPPPGVECSRNVCRLNKALYGLKQSPRAWFRRFSSFMKKIGYKHSDADHTLFIKNNNNGKVTTLIVYVDDMVVTRNDPEEMKNLQTILATEFELKDLGHLKYFLGIEVARSKSGISMCQCLFLWKESRSPSCGTPDADWAGDHHRQVTLHLVGGKSVTWRSQAQKVDLKVGVEAEYRGMVTCYNCDKSYSSFAVKSNNPVQHDRTKHVEID